MEPSSNVRAGLKLVDIVPTAFPCHDIIQHLKRELKMARDASLARFWRDNGPWALSRACELLKVELKLCNCHGCYGGFWEKILWYVKQSGLTYCVLPGTNMAAEILKGFGPTETDPVCAFPKPAGFNELVACKYMAPVSHIDVHIVFQKVEGVTGVVYGRKLWQNDSVDSPEIRKLDLLFASLHTHAKS
jgi:hypothetical protein